MAQRLVYLDGTKGPVRLFGRNPCQTSRLVQNRKKSTGSIFIGIDLPAVTERNGFEVCPSQSFDFTADDSPGEVWAVVEAGQTAFVIAYENTDNPADGAPDSGDAGD